MTAQIVDSETGFQINKGDWGFLPNVGSKVFVSGSGAWRVLQVHERPCGVSTIVVERTTWDEPGGPQPSPATRGGTI